MGPEEVKMPATDLEYALLSADVYIETADAGDKEVTA